MHYYIVYCITAILAFVPVFSIEPGERGSIHGTNFDELLAPQKFGSRYSSNSKTGSSADCDSKVAAENQLCANQLKEALQNVTVLNRRCDLIKNPAIKEAPFTRRAIRNLVGSSYDDIGFSKDFDQSVGENFNFEVILSLKRKDLDFMLSFVDTTGDENLIDIQNLLIDGLKYQKLSGKSWVRLFIDFYLPDLDIYLKLSVITVSFLYAVTFFLQRVRVNIGRQTIAVVGFLVFLVDFIRALYLTYLEEIAVDVQFFSKNTCGAKQKVSLTHWFLGRDDCAEMNMKTLISPIWRISLLEVFSKTLGFALVGIAGPLGRSLQVYLSQISWYYLPFALLFIGLLLLVIFGFNMRLQLPFVRFDININQRPQNARLEAPRNEDLNGIQDIPQNVLPPNQRNNQPIENDNVQPQIANEIAANDVGQPIGEQNGFVGKRQLLIENIPEENVRPDQGENLIRGHNVEMPSGYEFQQPTQQPTCSKYNTNIQKFDVSCQTNSSFAGLEDKQTATDPISITDLIVEDDDDDDDACGSYNIVNTNLNNLNQ